MLSRHTHTPHQAAATTTPTKIDFNQHEYAENKPDPYKIRCLNAHYISIEFIPYNNNENREKDILRESKWLGLLLMLCVLRRVRLKGLLFYGQQNQFENCVRSYVRGG